ncbi:phage major capsid protein [Streptomyces sp. MP131-18]|uniref:phage major capsid protein n=1 Tax=Streptomyces sp. MP131-18 TaxID=1857892 RepID=UPI00097C779D|nr:phage major capsid protein [Streptomyces sp. MP131-18]ONK09442.1 phage major capsid protein, HK97 family [Streptomyces sp. MP131-18]
MTTTSRTDELVAQVKAALGAARDIADRAEEDGDRDFTDAERAEIQAKMNEAAELKKKLDQAKADEKMRSAIADLGDGVGLIEKNEKGAQRTPSGLIVPDGKSLGQHFTSSKEYRELLASAPNGVFGKDHRVQSRPVGFERLVGRASGQKDLVTGGSDTSAGALVQPDYRGLQVGLDLFQRPLMLRDLVTNGTTSSDTVEYVRMTGVTNNAAPVPEATATAGTSGTKPESGLAAARVTTPVRTIAHWIPVTKRALSDAAQIRTLIDAFLQYGLEEELEDQMISGDGTGENFEGLASVSGVQQQAFDTDLLTTTRKAKTLVYTVGRSVPTGYVLHPLDVEALDLLQDNEGRYYFGGPSQSGMGFGGTAPLWSLPVIQSEGVEPGTGYIGDWRKAVLWDREQASITVSDSHADFFIRNMVAILAEMRAAFGVLQPSAFVEIDLGAGS